MSSTILVWSVCSLIGAFRVVSEGADDSGHSLVVNTRYGALRGARLSTGTDSDMVFHNIPYARPPVGAEHADELHYVFGSSLIDDYMWNGFVTSWTDQDKHVSDHVMTLWTNSAKNPTPVDSNTVSWQPWTQTSPNYLDIGGTDRAVSHIRAKQISVWTSTILRSERGTESIVD